MDLKVIPSIQTIASYGNIKGPTSLEDSWLEFLPTSAQDGTAGANPVQVLLGFQKGPQIILWVTHGRALRITLIPDGVQGTNYCGLDLGKI